MKAKFRMLAKYAAAVVIYYSGLLHLYRSLRQVLRPYFDFRILMYHRVVQDIHSSSEYIIPGIAVSSKVFERQIEYISEKYKVITLHELTQLLRSGKPIPRRCIIITFDDGWYDNYLCAYPILKNSHLPATIFLSTDYIDSNQIFWFLQLQFLIVEGRMSFEDVLKIAAEVEAEGRGQDSERRARSESVATATADIFAYVKKHDQRQIQRILERMTEGFGLNREKLPQGRWVLSWSEVKAMILDSIEFGSHGCSHRMLTNLTADEVLLELASSKSMIEAQIGTTVHSLAYPNGNFDEGIAKIASECGYDCAVTTKSISKAGDRFSLFALPRIGIHEHVTVDPQGHFSKAMFACHIEGLFEFLKVLPVVPAQLKNRVEPNGSAPKADG